MEHLNQISVGRTTITEQLPSSFENVEGLETPGLEGCSEPDEIGNFKSHEYVDLRHCALTAVLQEIGCTSTLEWLHLRANNFESLPACIEQRSRLTNLALCGRNMPQSLTELPLSLKLLDASDCERLQSLPEIPSYLEELDAPLIQTLL
ncbi:hypothetical protein WN944_015868 [Citrus x changshan-huyou]|uniref:Uncharacterized protein n=1 Tax=Citrus x changshan-huyou TaxID=2935761 RepID=A0AAP0MER2_9ROSI